MDIGWRVEAVIVSRGQVDDQLEEFVAFIDFKILGDERGVLLGCTSDQFAKGILTSFDCLALIS